MGKRLNIEKPKSFNEKLQWLKLNDRNPKYIELVDKYKVREYISKVLGDEYLIPLLGVYNSFQEIDFDKLPNQFVLKPNHTSGNVYLCKDKTKIDYIKLEKEINAWLKREYYWLHREWPYKNVNPKIICEKYIVDETKTQLKDYKFMCFNGEPKIIHVMSDRVDGNYCVNNYDINWNPIDIPRRKFPKNPKEIKRPKRLEEMIDISKKLSKGIPFSRIDLYSTDYGVFFGEITFYPVSGYMDFEYDETDLMLGSWIDLKEAYVYRKRD